MSTLTKILIVLLTLSSIFLCGTVVTYIASAENYKQLYDAERIDKQDAILKRNSANELLQGKKKEYQLQEDELRGRLASLNRQILNLKTELVELQTNKTSLEGKVQSWVTITNNLTKTAEEQRQLLENTLTELKQVKDDQIKERQQLNDVRSRLIEKMAQVGTLQTDKRRLQEERAELLRQLDELRLKIGKETAPVRLVTSEEALARPVPPVVRKIGLNGLMTAVDLKNALAEISIGTAHGVKERMRFYVTRGDKFVCELLIFDVDTEKAVGILERVKLQPKVGDTVSTNL